MPGSTREDRTGRRDSGAWSAPSLSTGSAPPRRTATAAVLGARPAELRAALTPVLAALPPFLPPAPAPAAGSLGRTKIAHRPPCPPSTTTVTPTGLPTATVNASRSGPIRRRSIRSRATAFGAPTNQRCVLPAHQPGRPQPGALHPPGSPCPAAPAHPAPPPRPARPSNRFQRPRSVNCSPSVCFLRLCFLPGVHVVQRQGCR